MSFGSLSSVQKLLKAKGVPMRQRRHDSVVGQLGRCHDQPVRICLTEVVDGLIHGRDGRGRAPCCCGQFGKLRGLDFVPNRRNR